MEKLFTTCLLVQDDASTVKIVQKQLNLHPGLKFPPDQESNVLLAGGFPSLTPDSEFPLSSTLFLNSSLAGHPSQTLTQIGQAELRRRGGVEFRSYLLEPDNRVAAIGNDAEKLLAFVDSYGGVLQIEPLLLKGCHPELPTVSELTLIPRQHRCTLEYQVRTPIDHEQCSYCGACGPACPEHCIDENLFLDFTACTLCRACEPVCPAKAIDVHAVQPQTVEVPGVILLDGVELEGDGSFLYRESELPRYFSTLFPTRLDEVVTWNQSLCQYSARLGYGCDLCAASCGFDAINRDDKGIGIDQFRCEECGSCVAVCPTGALQYERFTDRSFAEYLDLFPSFAGATVVIGSDDAFHRLWWLGRKRRYRDTFFMGFPNHRALSLFHYLSLAVHGAARLVILQEQPGDDHPEQLQLANTFIDKLFDIKDYASCMTVQAFAADDRPLSEPLTITSAGELHFINRRQAVSDALEILVRQSGRKISLKATGGLPFGTITCDEALCTQCGACLNDCRVGALYGDADELALRHKASLCVACGVCVSTCPEKSLSLSPAFTLDKEFFTPVELARAEPMACRRCGKIFGTKKSYERVMAILAGKETVDVSHFTCCETCRVLNIFEDQ